MRNWRPTPAGILEESVEQLGCDPEVLFALLEDAPGVPGLDLPGSDIVSLAKGFGCHKAHADTADE
jgi:hypothetical protein